MELGPLGRDVVESNRNAQDPGKGKGRRCAGEGHWEDGAAPIDWP
jgi:hypothetical protein